jgi:hypothetical protein
MIMGWIKAHKNCFTKQNNFFTTLRTYTKAGVPIIHRIQKSTFCRFKDLTFPVYSSIMIYHERYSVVLWWVHLTVDITAGSITMKIPESSLQIDNSHPHQFNETWSSTQTFI